MNYHVIGYGSLEDRHSLMETISNKHFKTVIVKGYRRVFNLRDKDSNGKDVLNLSVDKKSFFNGVMFSVTEKELEELFLRETEYDLEEAIAYDFETKEKLGKCLVFIDKFFELDKKKRLPDKEYFLLCRHAAYSLGKKFGKVWDETTFLSSGEKVSQWILKHKDYDFPKAIKVRA